MYLCRPSNDVVDRVYTVVEYMNIFIHRIEMYLPVYVMTREREMEREQVCICA